MIQILSMVTSVKDYLEVVHKLLEYDSDSFSKYTELGPIITYFIFSLKSVLVEFFSLSWLKNIWSLPILIPDISSAMISEISVLDGYFHNAFQLLDNPTLSPNEKDIGGFVFTGLGKFTVGLLNSCFLFLPTSTAHIITLRRFVMQGLDAGYISGLGTIAGNLFWLTSVILGWRFFVIPWLSLDVLRYLLGFALLVKYMWDSYNERKVVLEDLSKRKIFLFNFLLALTEQTSIYPFISNISVSPQASIFESFPTNNYTQFIFLHLSYLAGIGLGSFCLLQFTCWFWENPAFKIYMWVISSFKVSTSVYYKTLNFTFLYLTMLSAISSIPYYGLDYTITNPLGFVNDDRLVQDKTVQETSFLGTKASDRNTRRNRGRHGRRERWKRRIRKYRTFDASLYDQGIYDLFTIEDLNYGFDRFWLRRKLRNHRVRFRFFPGPWMRSFKKQLAKPRLESYTGPRIEFFRILFEQVYHPSFHARSRGTNLELNNSVNEFRTKSPGDNYSLLIKNKMVPSQNEKNSVGMKGTYGLKENFINENSMLRKFVRKLDTRLKTAEILRGLDSKRFSPNVQNSLSTTSAFTLKKQNKIYSKRWKELFSKIYHEPNEQISTSNFLLKNVHRNFFNSSLTLPKQMNVKFLDSLDQKQKKETLNLGSDSVGESNKNISGSTIFSSVKKRNSRINTISNKDLQILRYRSAMMSPSTNTTVENLQPFTLLHPLKFYLAQEASLQRKLRNYTPNIFRKFSVENNAPYFRVMMRRYFYNYKATNRWERTMKVASLRKARRKTTRTPKKLRLAQETQLSSNPNTVLNNQQIQQNKNNREDSFDFVTVNKDLLPNISGSTNTDLMSLSRIERIKRPTYNYSVVSKKASRYRYQIYKDVMQHWYYSPFNRLLLKFDVDNFIRRQPKTHFLTSNEENLLHLRRFFLSEHYNTLRWYTNMENYRTMKTQIGGSKSFASRAYNQQFAGTFKKIRHLFSITPTINTAFPFEKSLMENASSNLLATKYNINGSSLLNRDKIGQTTQNDSLPVLKFDQPLYNEYANTSKKPLLNPLVIHEELLNSSHNENLTRNQILSNKDSDLVSQSQNIIRNYLMNSLQERNNYIQKLINNNNYASLTQFLYSGQKLRGTSPTLNQRSLGTQEKEYLLTDTEQINIEKQYNSPDIKRLLRQNFTDFASEASASSLQNQKNTNPSVSPNSGSSLDNLYTTFLKNWKHRVNNQESLKNYLTSRIDKREKRKITKEKNLQQKIKLVNNWITNSSNINNITFSTNKKDNLGTEMGISNTQNRKPFPKSNLDVRFYQPVTSGLQKAISDGQNATNLNNSTLDSTLVTNLHNSKSSKKLSLSQLRVLQKNKLTREVQITTNKLNQIIKQLGEKPITRKAALSLKNKTILLLKNIKKSYEGLYFVNLNKILYLIKPMKQKTMKNWRQKQRFVGKQKRLRKEFKLLLTKKQTPQQTVLNLPSRKKRIDSQDTNITSSSTYNLNLQNILANDTSEKTSFGFVKSFLNFKRERSPQRRYRVRRNRGVFRKRNIGDLVKKDLKIFYNNTNFADKETLSKNILERNQFYSKLHSTFGNAHFNDFDSPELKDSSSLKPLEFQQARYKQRKNKQRKLRSWKQKRMSIRSSQKRRKYLKRRRYTISKIRVLGKQYQRVKNKLEMQNWWWKQYLPSIQASTDALWQIEKDRLIQQKLSELSSREILDRDMQLNLNKNNIGGGFNLQIGNKDFKPLALPEAIRIQSRLSSQNFTPNQNSITPGLPTSSNSFNSTDILVENNSFTSQENQQLQLINELYKNVLSKNNFNNSSLDKLSSFNLVPNTSLPFYAGWDESLRKFVVTNRLLSRQDAGYEVDKSFVTKNILDDENFNTKQNFTEAPLQGMNAATTLYWQIPFTTYDPDQFFALGMDGFSPIAWRKMVFRHSILKTWLGDKMMLNKTIESSYPQENASILGIKNTYGHKDLLNTLKKSTTFTTNNLNQINRQDNFNKIRRLNKRLLRVKKHPRTPVWFPSGPLLNQVLPVHYIYVFYKRSRLPRNRYLSRRLLNITNINNNESLTILKRSNPSLFNYDFTLRKRLKPKRKYHLKHDSSIVIPRRLKLLNFVNNLSNSGNNPQNDNLSSLIRWRPLPSKNINKSLFELMNQQKILRAKRQQRLANTSSTDQPSLRVKQLKRRVFHQTIRSIWRYRPRAGGFVWPGDYLKLELVKAPKLKANVTYPTGESNFNPSNIGQMEKDLQNQDFALKRKTKRKKKRNLVEWQVQPKKYLYEKHNRKVLKKKLEKAQRSMHIPLHKQLKQLDYNL